MRYTTLNEDEQWVAYNIYSMIMLLFTEMRHIGVIYNAERILDVGPVGPTVGPTCYTVIVLA